MRLLTVLLPIALLLSGCGSGSSTDVSANEWSPLETGSTFGELASHCDIADPVFGAVKLFGDLDVVGFVIPRSAAPYNVPQEGSAEDLAPEQAACLHTAQSDSVQGCGVVDWIGTDLTTAHARGHEVTPVLFLADTTFTGTPTKLFGTCGGSSDDRDPTLFAAAASLTISPSPDSADKKAIADIVSRLTTEFTDLNDQEPLALAQCENLAVLLERANAMATSLKEMFGSTDELFPQQVIVDTSKTQDVVDHRTSMRSPEFDASVFDETSVSTAVDEIRQINVAWEDLAIDLADAGAVPEEVRQSWAHWRLGVALDRPFTPHYEATIEHLSRVSESRCEQ